MIRDAPNGWMRAARKLLGGQEKKPPMEQTNSFELRDQFLSEEEVVLFRLLCDALGDRAMVCPKTRVSNVLRVSDAHQHLGDAVRIDRKFIDFLICDPSSRRPVCAVQLDRWMEDVEKYQLRDEFLEHAFAVAGLSVLHVGSDRIPSPEMIRAKIIPLLEKRSVRKTDVKNQRTKLPKRAK